MVAPAFFTSLIQEYGTPHWLFDALDVEFHFTLDVCASAENAKCQTYFTKEQDGLAQRWTGTCWMNPPYGRNIRRWIEKARNSNATVVCLLPARTNTRWWFEVVADASEVRFIHPKLQFDGAAHVAPFPSAVVIFPPSWAEGG